MQTSLPQLNRRLPVGAEILHDGQGAHFRVWAPDRTTVSVLHEDSKNHALQAEKNGYFSGTVAGMKAGDRYKYQLDGSEGYPDPVSRCQPVGPHGFSALVDPSDFSWTDDAWQGVKIEGQVVYELHLGTFTRGGTWKAAADKLEYLRDTGITVIEVMPVAEFPGRFGWGYDGVFLFAPAAIYGTPSDMRAFVDRAHALGIAVILDVVYNHLGPDGNYLAKFSPYYFTERHKTDWGSAINFDGEHSGPVREFYLSNASYWIREFHLDGLRLDATQDIHDDSKKHILAEISCTVRDCAGSRSTILIGENEPQNTGLLRSVAAGGCGLDALWNDDYHHSAMVALTGKSDAYYSDYRGTSQEFVSCMKYGYLFQGQRYRWQKQRRGRPTFGLPPASMVSFIQNHDQVANSARGQRIHELCAPGALKAVTALTLLGPGTPMLFQGQEFGSTSRFLFFADHNPELSALISTGRHEFLNQWRSLSEPNMYNCMPDPSSPHTFESCVLDFSEVEKNHQVYALHRDLLRMRREDPIISQQAKFGIDGAVLSPHCLLLRFFSETHAEDRLLVVNLDGDLELNPAPEPLLAPPIDSIWETLWSSDEPQYGGCGTPRLDSELNWNIPGQAAVLLRPTPRPEA